MYYRFFLAFEFLHSNFSVFLENIHGRRRASSSAPDLTISEAKESDGDQFSESPADQLTDLLLALLKVNQLMFITLRIAVVLD